MRNPSSCEPALNCGLWSHGSGEAVGIAACFDVAGDGECLQVEDGDVGIAGAGDVGALVVGLDKDATGAVADGEAFDFFLRCDVEDHQFRAGGDEGQFAVGGEFETVRAAGIGGEGGGNLSAVDVDDGDSAIPCVRDPGLLMIGGDVEAFGAASDSDNGFAPIAAGRT